MTLLAGIVSRRSQHPVPASMCATLRAAISRAKEAEVSVFKDARSYLLKVDIGAFGEPAAHVAPDGALSLLAGAPLLRLRADDAGQSRTADLAVLHDACTRGDWHMFAKANGSFCAAHYDPRTSTISLIADKLGLRPLYYWLDERYVVFATALRMLEALAELPKKMDVRAVTEIVGLGFPLAGRTPYADVSVLREAEVVQVSESAVTRRPYWRWDAISPASASAEDLLRASYHCFTAGVARRVRADTTTVAYLSGGLDSRCVVAALHDRKVRVHTFNFARPGTQDYAFGNDFAAQLGTMHEAIPKEPGDLVPDYSTIMAQVWGAAPQRWACPAERPALVWSGEGGSVALGHVHMSQEIAASMRAGQVDAAIAAYLRRESVHVPPKLFRAGIFASVADVIETGIREQLSALNAADPARNFYLFLLLNDQRRKLAGHFERIDLHRLEFQLPFFDSSFLTSIIAAPLELCLAHKFYTRWLALFPPAVMAVPWQTYPEHESCPLPGTQALGYQWDEKSQRAERAAQHRALLRQATELLHAPDFPAELLSKKYLRLAKWMHFVGWRDYEYFIKAASTYHTYWQKCGGAFMLPAAV